MKYIITERQFRLLREEDIENPIVPKKIKKINYSFFNDNWYELQDYLNRNETLKNTPYLLVGDLNFNEDPEIPLATINVVSLGSLVEVTGNLNLHYSDTIKDLGKLRRVGGFATFESTKIKSLGDLESVGKNLILTDCKKLTDLGKLNYVGGDLAVDGTPISDNKTKEEIGSQVKVGRYIFT